MPAFDSARKFLDLLHSLQHEPDARRDAVEAGPLEHQMLQLREWQSRRLANTYEDLMENPQYQSACRFFLDEVYAARDFSARDHDAERLQSILSKYLPESMLCLLNDAVRLNRLSSTLDRQLLGVLTADPDQPLTITFESYAAAYRVCDNYGERKEQIDLLVNVLSEAAYGAQSPVFAVGLRLARLPSLRLGWNELYEFLEHGYKACKPMRDIEGFVGVIRRRELALLDRFFSNAGLDH